jgi:hypothetical protein
MNHDDPNPESLDAVLARLHLKVDMLCEDMKQVKSMVQGHDQFKYWILGAAAVLGGLTSRVITWIAKGDK